MTSRDAVDAQRPAAEMACAPDDYFRRRPRRRTFARVAMIGAVLGMACGFVALVWP